MRRRRASMIARAAVAAGLSFAAWPASAQVLRTSLPQIESVGVVERRGAPVPTNLRFTDSLGRPVRTAEFFDGRRPVLLVPAYYDCPLLCTLVLNRVQKALNEMSWTLGQEFRVITFSFDHTNTTQQAREKQTTYLAGYGRGVPEAAGQPEAAWMFLTGDVENIRALTTAVGYHYKYLADAKEFSHPAAIIVLSPEGEVHNYIEKLDFSGTEVQLALAEAADGRVGTIFERIRHFCFRYDPKTGQYSADAFAIMQVGASLSAACLGGFIIYIARRRGGGARAEGSAGPRGQEVHA